MWTAILVATPIFGLTLQPPDLPAPSLGPVVVSATASGAIDEPAAPDASAANERRRQLRPWHIAFGNLAWGATTITTILGIIQYRDRYGAFDPELQTPCARGDAIMSNACDGVPAGHAISATLLLAMYSAAFSIGVAMPDPARLAESPGTYGRRLRRHKALRWVVLGMLVAQTALGAISANLDDYETRRGLATGHMVLGSATWVTMLAMGVYGSLLAY